MSRKPASEKTAVAVAVATNFLPPHGKDSHLIALLSGLTCVIDRNGGEGTPIAAIFRANAFRDGCTQVADGEQVAPKTEDELDETIRLIVDAIEAMVAAGEPDTLHPDGRPVLEALSAKVGFTVSGPQYDKAFEAFEASL